MSKPKQKKAIYNDDIIKGLIQKYGFKRDYILKSIRGERTGTYPLIIKEEYHKLDREAKKAVNKKINEL
ncbi:hypothetical protein [Flavobacterium suncheonense]|uniref:Uncharacterized protein n=1 Tax=Flavobacterium suncheonense GH29-5 = DSM 17707 TaxID=1121899 RepID=A0A0A2MAT2_9FLAO|nr:hypothetical protein [Flavobacterium suncheonense]KGO89767.1 hypothetical protein Q764_06160 [Flavobacterium suncheonense GH29-5 = DSM 17707]